MAYTGTGTQDDPYVVDSWDDYITLAQSYIDGTYRYSNTPYIKFADVDNKIIDLNDIKPEGYRTQLPCRANIDFNGWTIRNLRMISVARVFNTTFASASSGWNTIGIKNAKFENCYIESSSENFGIFAETSANMQKKTEIRNVSFSGTFVYTGTSTYVNVISYIYKKSYLYNQFIGCSFNFVITVPTTVTEIRVMNNSAFENCSLKIKTASNAKIILAYTEYITTLYMTFLNSLIQVESEKSIVDVCSASSDVVESVSNRITTCAIIPTCKELKSTAKCVTTVYNSDNIETDSTAGSGLIPCTTEQLGSVDYLQSVGFPIGAG